MTRLSWRTLERVGFLLIVKACLVCTVRSTLAQSNIVPDDTLGDESSRVRTDEVKGNPAEVIEGGAQRGANLFHSFSEFNVEGGRGVYFANPNGVENILGRVTGTNPSEILGTLGVLGNADLFLINPNGIIFGENARLDVNGSFIGSTADEIGLGERGSFIASEPETSNLLTINPSALFFNAMAAEEIINRSQAGLQVPENQTLALIGGDVFLEGGNLTVAGGNIELGSLAREGKVSLNRSNSSWQFNYDEANSFGNIRLQDGAFVDVSGDGGGNVRVRGAQFEMSNSGLLANTLDALDGKKILVSAKETVTIEDDSTILTNTAGFGSGGDIRIETGQLAVLDGSLIGANTTGEGEGGTLTINASESVIVRGFAILKEDRLSASQLATSGDIGNGGALTIETGQLAVEDGGFISATTSRKGDAGALTINASESVAVIGESAEGKLSSGIESKIFSTISGLTSGTGTGAALTIETGRLTVKDGGFINAATSGTGDAGALTINASESVAVIGEVAVSQLFTSTSGTGDAGALTIETGQLSVEDGGFINAGTLGTGDGGALTINASESVAVIGELAESQFPSLLSTSTQGEGDAGALTIETRQLTVRDGASILTRTLGKGDGNSLTINTAESVEVIGESANGQFTSSLSTSTQGEGNAGNLLLETGQLIVRDGAQIDSATLEESSGNGGTLTIKAFESVELIGKGGIDEQYSSGLFTQTEGEGDADNLTIETEQLTVQDGADVSTSTFGEGGNAGNLTIDTSLLTLQNNGELAVSGQGDFNPGNLTVTADNIILDNQSTIEANTESGSQGNITLNTSLLTLRNNSNITTNAEGTATGGNITINAEDGFILAVPKENSDITANATAASGGSVQINARSLFGIEAREQLTPLSDITASSNLGVNFSGNVTINTPKLDPESGLNELPTVPIDADALIVQNLCNLDEDRIAGGSSFTITGRGGLPPTAEDPVTNQTRIVNWEKPASESLNPNSNNTETELETSVPEPSQPVIQQAQGWAKTKDGKIVLTANAPIIVPSTGTIGFPDCSEN